MIGYNYVFLVEGRYVTQTAMQYMEWAGFYKVMKYGLVLDVQMTVKTPSQEIVLFCGSGPPGVKLPTVFLSSLIEFQALIWHQSSRLVQYGVPASSWRVQGCSYQLIRGKPTILKHIYQRDIILYLN